MTRAVGPTVYHALSECAVTLTFEQRIDAGVSRRIQWLDHAVRGQPFEGFRAAVPAYATLTVYYDPLIVVNSPTLSGISAFERVVHFLTALQDRLADTPLPDERIITIPVCYGGEYGPDLDAVAHQLGLAAEEVIQVYSTAEYQVHLIGFIPGFAYLGGLPERLETPRKATPRVSVPAGSVGIGGQQTGVYPLDTPGGWQLIGRTPLRMFDPARTHPALLEAGDCVIFQPISAEEFREHQLLHHADTDT
ncbi:5-oxoprolinase subunit PxpB [Parapedobacter sp. DT-150]|uniref:5-oxoprolinase subunit PxpB n=1 Tax=Parapedobacter sp. DT-150 TaxID=3396162 RepID=UPI003F19E932